MHHIRRATLEDSVSVHGARGLDGGAGSYGTAPHIRERTADGARTHAPRDAPNPRGRYEARLFRCGCTRIAERGAKVLSGCALGRSYGAEGWRSAIDPALVGGSGAERVIAIAALVGTRNGFERWSCSEV